MKNVLGWVSFLAMAAMVLGLVVFAFMVHWIIGCAVALPLVSIAVDIMAQEMDNK